MLSSQNLEIALGGISQISVPGTYFKYQAGTVSAGTDFTIGVKFGNQGDEVDLVPGNAIRLQGKPDTWRVRNKGSGTVTLKLVIGDGEFLDANVSFSGGITVGNEVEVKNDSGSPLTVQENLIAINQSYGSNSLAPWALNGWGYFYETVLAPASNVNGCIIHACNIIANATPQTFILVAHTAMPTGSFPAGDVIYMDNAAVNGQVYRLPAKVKVPAGKGIYLMGIGAIPAAAHARSVVMSI